MCYCIATKQFPPILSMVMQYEAVSVNISFIPDVTLCSLVDRCKNFWVIFCSFLSDTFLNKSRSFLKAKTIDWMISNVFWDSSAQYCIQCLERSMQQVLQIAVVLQLSCDDVVASANGSFSCLWFVTIWHTKCELYKYDCSFSMCYIMFTSMFCPNVQYILV
jgi:hypothetical protein